MPAAFHPDRRRIGRHALGRDAAPVVVRLLQHAAHLQLRWHHPSAEFADERRAEQADEGRESLPIGDRVEEDEALQPDGDLLAEPQRQGKRYPAAERMPKEDEAADPEGAQEVVHQPHLVEQ